MIIIKQKGDYSKISRYLQELKKVNRKNILEKYASKGVGLLQQSTPTKTGKTAASWYYDIETDSSGSKIIFRNSNINKGVPIAIILQYGHGTGTGGYVEGIDYINPPMQHIFKQLADEIWKEVTSL